MAAPTAFNNGITNANSRSTLAKFLSMDPTKVHSYFNDFDIWTAGDWTVTKTEAGSGNASVAVTAVDGGNILVTNDDADDDNYFAQHVAAGWLMETGKRAWFKARFRLSDATNSDFVIGLQALDTTPLDVTDGIYFIKPDDAATMNFIVGKDATTGRLTTSAVATLANSTFVTVGWYYDGKAALEYYINDVKTGTVDPTNYFPDAQLTVSWGLQNGAAAAKTATIDYIFAAKER